MRKKRYLLLLPVLLIVAFVVYVSIHYPADSTAIAALESSPDVAVEPTPYGWCFDGPADDAALVFYPGAKVEAAAYAPLLHRLAAAGLDCCLVKMPFRLAVFDINAAKRVMRLHDYPRWYVGGHSLGGAMAADFAARYPVDGLILLAAYPTRLLGDDMIEVLLYGSEDGVLNLKKVESSRKFSPAGHTTDHVIRGGNHARFGSSGPQKGDGVAPISPEAQGEETVIIIMESING